MSTPFFTCIIAWVCENVNKNIDLFVYKYIICKSVGFDTDYNISLAYSPCADGPLLMPRRRWLSAWHPESQALADLFDRAAAYCVERTKGSNAAVLMQKVNGKGIVQNVSVEMLEFLMRLCEE